VAVAGEDFAIIASDTRLIQGYSILSREQTKLFKLSEQTVLGVSGCWCDVLTFTRTLEARMKVISLKHIICKFVLLFKNLYRCTFMST
jgi:20S proteasome subunit beta 6